jgi:formylglycine-generating enzyme required for sulfatase activity
MPYNIDKPGRQFNPYDNHPAENLCWFEALAFCRWLSDRLGCAIDLPTEWQWQQAATGGDPENVYPWGEAWDDGRANTDESELGRTTAVGLYPHGASPVGALDMAGNVWEWCRNEFERPGRAGLTGEAERVMRGGSCNNNPINARAAFRNRNTPNNRNNNVGFRVVYASHI